MRDEIKKILATVLGLPYDKVADDISVETAASWDSLRQIRLIMALEERFGFRFSDESINNMTSLRSIVSEIEGLGK